MNKKLIKIALILLVIGIIFDIFGLSVKCTGSLLPYEDALCAVSKAVWFVLWTLGAIFLAVAVSYPTRLVKIGMSILFLSALFVAHLLYYITFIGGNRDEQSVGTYLVIYYFLFPLLILGFLITIIGGSIYKKSRSKSK